LQIKIDTKTMWHQQRKEEKRIKGLMVDKRRRAERRRNYYEQIKMDPNQFLQVPYLYKVRAISDGSCRY
jgi:hypothetical protein